METERINGLRIRKLVTPHTKMRDAYKPVYAYHKNSMDGLLAEKDKTRWITTVFIHNFFLGLQYKKIKALTLPGVHWLFERQMLKRFFHRKPNIRATFISCERDYKLFKLAGVKMPKSNKGIRANRHNNELNRQVVTNGNNCCLIYSDVFDFIKTTDKKFDLMWLDLTSTVASVVPKLKDEYFSKVFNETAVFVLTVLKAREHIKIPMERTEYVCSVINDLGFTLEKKIEYQDFQSPMLHLIFTRKKPTT